jgi:hypothetical protein
MPKDQLFYTDGASLKSIDLPQYPNEAWTWYSGQPEMKNAELYSSVAAVYRVANMSADAVSHLPFVILNQSGDEVDSSADWQNVVGFMDNPRELLRLWRLSLFFTNTAYGFMEGNRVERNLRYLRPDTMEPVIDEDLGLVAFKRKLKSTTKRYEIYENPLDNKIFWMFWRDHTTEIEASKNTEFKALMNAAGVIYYSDEHIKNFYARGGIKPALLKVNGVPTREDRDKIEKWWDRVMRGITKFLGNVIVADTMEVETIGEGVDNLKDNELYKNKIEDVALAAGIPLSLLLANSANYATAQVEKSTWFEYSVVPKAEMMADAMNELLFEPMGYQIDFKPEITNIGTQEEQERAGAFAAYVASNVKPSVAAQMLGMEVPSDYETLADPYGQLDLDYYEMLERKTAANAVDMPEISEPKPPKDQVQPDLEKTPMPKSAPTLLTIDQLRELELWQSFAFRKMKRGESLDFPFVCKELPESVASDIREVLPDCKTERDIERAFKMDAPRRDDSGLKELAEALNKLVPVVVGDNIESYELVERNKDDGEV